MWLPAETWPASETKRWVVRKFFLKGFECADDVIVPLHWAPDRRHKSGLAYVRETIVDAILPLMFHNPSK